MVSDDLKTVVSFLQPMSPFLESELDDEKLSVANAVILLRWGILLEIEGTWMEALRITLPL